VFMRRVNGVADDLLVVMIPVSNALGWESA
jgi:hypothetical protein